MLLFLIGVGILIGGYFTYGRFVRWVVSPDDRRTPALEMADGVDYVPLPHWKNMLIQLLNIAGVGPVIGVILGIKFGPVVFLLLPVGNVLGGAVHDFLGGMMSLRSGGANLPRIIHGTLGGGYYRFFAVFMVLLLLLVVAVFVNVPAAVMDGLMGKMDASWNATRADFWCAVAVIFVYYVLATLFPVDKIIGRVYPFFGLLLFLGTGALLVSLLWTACGSPVDILTPTEAFRAGMITAPVIPCLFVTIACGIMSGFHATQSPIIARTMRTEREAYASFYGMMIAEGLIAMVWAAGAMAVYNMAPELMRETPQDVLPEITQRFLGGGMGTVTLLAVVVLAVTSGDTALRSLRLSLAEMWNVPQKVLRNRLMICLPLMAIIVVLLAWSNRDTESFNILWNYFAWGNQVLAASTLLAGMAWLIALRRWWGIAAVPACFMAFVVLTYILWTSPAHGGPVGLGLPLSVAYGIAALGALGLCLWAYRQGLELRMLETFVETEQEMLDEDVSDMNRSGGER